MSTPSDRLPAAITRLRRQGELLVALLEPLDDAAWRRATPAAGWSIAHQIAHLSWTEVAALTSLRAPQEFAVYRARSAADPLHFVDAAAEAGAQLAPAELLARWQQTRHDLSEALEQADPEVRHPWFGPGMKALSMTTARIMETWAHGHDVATALGADWPDTEALFDIAHLGIATRGFAYQLNELALPEWEVFVSLTGPAGQTRTWGDPAAEQSIRGSARDFALLVTQRAEVADLALEITGAQAQQWAAIAQVFAGPPKSVVRARQQAAGSEHSEDA